MKRTVYHARFALRLWWIAPGMSIIEAFRYPCDHAWGSGDPIEDADTEMSYWE